MVTLKNNITFRPFTAQPESDPPFRLKPSAADLRCEMVKQGNGDFRRVEIVNKDLRWQDLIWRNSDQWGGVQELWTRVPVSP